MASTADTPRARAEAAWQDAQRQRARIVRNIDKLKKGTSGKPENEQLIALENDMAQFRLYFALTISQDPKYTFENDIENAMWELHNLVNTVYRDLLHNGLRSPEQVITRKKVEKLYTEYLNTAAAFYTGYFQRLQVLHGIPQIARINRILKLEPPQADSKVKSSHVGAAVQRSFYATLIRLGDISRWRYKIRPKSQALKMAALYYELAIDLDPRSGGAHHQLGILDRDNHLHVVYRFYRSIAVDAPHPYAKEDLEEKFERLSQGTSLIRRHGPPEPTEAFSSWFTKLHARLYKGERYPRELEEEVLHGLVKTLEKPDALPILLKMAITNIAAYHVAKQKIEKEWSREASDSCQLILRLNIQWILILSRTMKSKLQEFINTVAIENADANDAAKGSSPQPFSIFAESVLPLTRLYVAWLVIYRNDIVQFQDHLAPHVSYMHRDLAESLTMVAGRFNQELSAVPYLLIEDAESLGLKPFDDINLHEVCRLHHVPGKLRFKPHWEDGSCSEMTRKQQTMSRVHDLLRCGFVLALDDKYPLNLETSGGTILITHVEGTKVPFAAQDPRLDNAALLLANGNASHPARDKASHERCSSPQADRMSRGGLRTEIGDNPRASVQSPIVHVALQDPNSNTTSKVTEDSDSELDIGLENRLQDMVDHLMGDDTSIKEPGQTGGHTQDVLHTVLHTASQHPSKGAAVNGQGPGMLFDVTRPNNIWCSFQGLGSLVAKPSNTLDAPWRGPSNDIHPSETANRSTLQQAIVPTTSGLRPASGSGVEGPSLFSLGNVALYGAHHSQDGVGQPTKSPGLYDSSSGHSRLNLGASYSSLGMTPYLSALSGYTTSVDKVKSGSPPVNLENGSSSFSTTCSPTTSSLPPVNSPFGMCHPMLKFSVPRYRTYSALTSNRTQIRQYLQPGHINMVNHDCFYDGTIALNSGLAVTRND